MFEAKLGKQLKAYKHLLNPYPANVECMVAPTNASKWRMVFNSAFKGLNTQLITIVTRITVNLM